jgi:hypothetical protein
LPSGSVSDYEAPVPPSSPYSLTEKSETVSPFVFPYPQVSYFDNDDDDGAELLQSFKSLEAKLEAERIAALEAAIHIAKREAAKVVEQRHRDSVKVKMDELKDLLLYHVPIDDLEMLEIQGLCRPNMSKKATLEAAIQIIR